MLLSEAVGSMCQIDSLRIERGSGAWAASGTGCPTVNWGPLLALAFAVIMVLSEN